MQKLKELIKLSNFCNFQLFASNIEGRTKLISKKRREWCTKFHAANVKRYISVKEGDSWEPGSQNTKRKQKRSLTKISQDPPAELLPTGLKITTGQRTMSGLIVRLTGQTLVFPVILTGHFWMRTFYYIFHIVVA